MEITKHVESDVTILVVDGRVDTQGAVDLDLVLHEEVAEERRRIVLDMAAVEYIGSAGLRALANVRTKNREAGGDLKLVALGPRITRVFRIIGFDRVFSIYDSVEAGIADF